MTYAYTTATGTRYEMTDDGYLTDAEARAIAVYLDLPLPTTESAALAAVAGYDGTLSPAQVDELVLFEIWAEHAESPLVTRSAACLACKHHHDPSSPGTCWEAACLPSCPQH